MIQCDYFDRGSDAGSVVSDGAFRTLHGESYRLCETPFSLIDGGLSRDIVTFLYTKEGPCTDDIVEERSALVFLSPKGSRLYTSSNPLNLDTIVVFDSTAGSEDSQGTQAHHHKVWENGFENLQIIHEGHPLTMDVEGVIQRISNQCRGGSI